MPTVTLRVDPEVEAALDYLGATHGSRSKIIREAVLALADWHRAQDSDQDPRALRELAEVAELQRHLETVRTGLNRLVQRPS
jgi:predicted transcriptional regulator